LANLQFPNQSISVSSPKYNNQPLTIYLVGGFFFCASLLPGFGGSFHPLQLIKILAKAF